MLAAVLLASLVAGAQGTKKDAAKPTVKLSESDITVVRKPGEESGSAQMTVNGKVRKIAPHAVAAWKVRNGEGSLVLVVVQPKGSTGKQYVLRYYELDSGRKRVLATLPMASGSLKETDNKDSLWAFALSGVDAKTQTPIVVVGDDRAVTGFITGASAPQFDKDSLNYMLNGEKRSAPLGTLLGTDLAAIYEPPHVGQAAPQLLQVFLDGTALVMTADGKPHKAKWQTDGETVAMEGGNATYSVKVTDLKAVKGVPAGKRFSVRMLDELSSAKTHQGAIVKALSITPVVVDDQILIPAGSTMEGKVIQANSVGWGFKHETASLTIDWTKATLADGRELAMTARVFEVENSQEAVKENGKIQGIRSTGTPGYSAENGVLALAGIDPIAYIFAMSSGSAVLGFAEPEILYHAGTELILENMRPLLTSQSYAPSVLPYAQTDESRAQLQAFVRKLPFRTTTKGSNKPSDLTNLVFVGSPEALERAFKAAGWLPTDTLTANSTFKTIKTLSGNSTYTQAPMSVLLLDEREPLFGLSKTTNTFSSRHHIRVFPTVATEDGKTVMTASSTQDIGIAFSRKQKTFIHVIDQHIDNERSKVVNDLVFTGCVDNLDLVDRSWAPRDAYNSTGDRLLTDGRAAVVFINGCQSPRTTPDTIAPLPPRGTRIVRDTSLTIRNGIYRGNLIYMGIAGGITVRNYFKNSRELPTDKGAWRKTDASGAEYKGKITAENEEVEQRSGELQRRKPGEGVPEPSAEDLVAIQTAKESHKWDPPRYEFALQGGYMHMREDYLSAVGVLETSSDLSKPTYFVFLVDDVGDGWAGGGSVTVNSWKHFSNEFSYFRQQVKYQLGTLNATIPAGTTATLDEDDIETIPIGLVTRQFEYNLLIHATRPTSRWRPYAAVGPVFQLVALNGSPLKKPAGPFTLGLKNIGLIKAAFDFSRTPPLDGGGIFQFGLQYGAGVKFRVTPRMMLRADFRETWSKNPDIIANSYEDFDPNDLDATYTTNIIRVGPEKKFLQDRYTIGVAFTF